ncbi:triacylglycerol lipase [Mechercharimyces sp. CAU 1602]|uniref:esterase/lipase family protein n=1 Tax=Mechercharimyces sp. CAU 1602 TaxID=2973933 RepID=UPI002163F047|nr:hypothetical protein [Mechercharimyces sp. CAU 1602]MCS1351319.1 hypothetical protein [Mechercharimyces sp. CAU 1602]
MRQASRLLLALVILFVVALPSPVAWAGKGSDKIDFSLLEQLVEKGNVLSADEIASWENKTETGLIPGTWYVGESPNNVDEKKSPIVFVQGLGSNATTWLEGSGNMYDVAREEGYQTAFVQLYDAAGDKYAAAQWDNGRILAEQLQQISDFYGKKVNIVAHSKGGIDSQTALIHYNADYYVDNVVTLASPHKGSHLANLSYSWYAGWLADVIGMQSDGTYSLQTAEMDQFRKRTDVDEDVNENEYFTVAGKDWGSFGSSLWLAGAYLRSYGSNDGAVNVWSTKLMNGKHLFTDDDLNHYSITEGKKVFSRIESVVDDPASLVSFDNAMQWKAEKKVMSLAGSKASANEVSSESATGMEERGEQYLQGGELKKKATVVEEVAVQSDVDEAVFQVMSKNKVKIKLISPSGKVYTKKSSVYSAGEGKEFFNEATIQAFKVAKPEAGAWKVQMKSKSDDAYFMMVAFDGEETASVDIATSEGEGDIPVEIELKNPEKFDQDSIKIDMKIVDVDQNKQQSKQKKEEKKLKKNRKQGSYDGTFTAKKKSGSYNVTINIEGKLKNGEPFKRTLVRSVGVSK